MTKHTSKGFAIVLAWPETYCKQAGAWYDSLMYMLSFNKNGYYKAGHAAIVLVDPSQRQCHYFDFGRYHTPVYYGRVRSAKTDPDLVLHTKPRINGLTLLNLDEILDEVAKKEVCHGTGNVWASLVQADYPRMFHEAERIQQKCPLPYGPFVLNGTNCSRFVYQVLLAGKLHWWQRLKLRFPYTLTPSPMSNVKTVGRPRVTETASENESACVYRKGVLPERERPGHISVKAQWLSGEGAGSWFDVKSLSSQYLITRYSPKGMVEFEAVYEMPDDQYLDLSKTFQLLHLSHYTKIKIRQSGQTYVLKRSQSSLKLTH